VYNFLYKQNKQIIYTINKQKQLPMPHSAFKQFSFQKPNRFSGDLGHAGIHFYIDKTGRLYHSYGQTTFQT